MKIPGWLKAHEAYAYVYGVNQGHLILLNKKEQSSIGRGCPLVTCVQTHWEVLQKS